MEILRADGRTYNIGFLKDLTPQQLSLVHEIYSQYTKDGRKIEAIKKIRQLLITGLVEAKDLIEAFDNLGERNILFKLRPPVERFKKYRRINFGKSATRSEQKVFSSERGECQICYRDLTNDSVAVVTRTGERIGFFCRKCYDYLITLPETLDKVKMDIDSALLSVNKLKNKT